MSRGRTKRSVRMGPAHWPGSVLVLVLGIWVLWSAASPLWDEPEVIASDRLTTTIQGTWRAREPWVAPSNEQGRRSANIPSADIPNDRLGPLSEDAPPQPDPRPEVDPQGNLDHGNPDVPTPVDPQRGGLKIIEVRKNDSLWKISKRVLGRGERWKELAALNPQVDPNRLREGLELRVPKDASRPSRKPAQEHVVRRGENLSTIARKYYSDRNWQRIFKANRKHLRNANVVPPGTVLLIPEAPASRGNR